MLQTDTMTKAKDLILLLSVLCIHKLVQCEATSPSCDDGWLHYGNACYLINNIKSVSRPAADAECKYYDSSLLEIKSSDVLDFLVGVFRNYPSSGYWTSLNDISNNILQKSGTGIWRWGTHNRVNMSLTLWNTSPTGDALSNCAGVNIQGKMEDRDCNSRQMSICKTNGSLGCPFGWLHNKNSCYFVQDQLKTWEQAKIFCEKLDNSNLLVVGKDDEDFLKDEMPYLGSTTHILWTGLRSTIPGVWGWYNQAYFDPSFVQWQTEPDNVAGVENCGVLRTNGRFSDRNCSSNANFVCNKPQYSVSADVGCGTWIRAGRSCYGFITGSHAGTWTEARNYCRSMGGDLAKVDSFAKKAWLEMQLTYNPAYDRFYWVGLNDISNEGTYVWADGSPANHTLVKWNQAPNNLNGQENCAVLYNTGNYNDVPCFTQASAVCEKDNVLSDPCQSGWLRFAKNCYLFTPYDNVSLLYNQLEAEAFCQASGGHLLSLDDKNEKDFIVHMVRDNSKLSGNNYGWWTSLNDKQGEGFWMFGSEILNDPTLIDWDGEPSSRNGDNCALITFAGRYLQRNCSLKNNFICEMYVKHFHSANGSKDTNRSNGSGPKPTQ